MYDRFEPFSQSFVRAIVDDDLQRLTQIRWYVLRVSILIKPMILLPN
jgi:hypothetical protein